MMIQQFAEKHKLKMARDECGDAIIRGKRGHLYFDRGALCAMWTDAPPMNRTRLESLGVACWQGDISRDAKCRAVRFPSRPLEQWIEQQAAPAGVC